MVGGEHEANPHAPLPDAAGRVAFRLGDGVGALIVDFRSSIPSPSFPLFTLHWTLRSAQRKTRSRADRYSFLVRLFHSLLHAGLARRTVMGMFRQRVSELRNDVMQ